MIECIQMFILAIFVAMACGIILWAAPRKTNKRSSKCRD